MLRMNSRRTGFVAWGVLFLACQAAPVMAGESEIVREESIDVAAWSAKVVQRSHGQPNSDAVLLDLIVVEKGRTRVLAKDIIGPIAIFDGQRKIISCESQGSAMVGRGPIIFDLDGRKTDGPKHPGYLRQCARVERANLLLLHYNLVRDGKPFSFARLSTPKVQSCANGSFIARASSVFCKAGKRIESAYRSQIGQDEPT
ncbi:MAG: hypothetical protein DME26_22645 [Verrucomicrobia bacterium]|nr:MAG: hypothetical protein DME26_22645 [Verrucomicrobiota bacterium]